MSTDIQVLDGKYTPVIEELVELITTTNDTVYVKGEYFGYFVNRLVRSYLQTDDINQPRFNSMNFAEPKRKALAKVIDRLAAYLNRGDPLSSADDLRYILLSTYYRVGAGLPNLRVFLRGLILVVRDDIQRVNMVGTGDRDRAINLRRYVVTQGVLNDVLGGRIQE
jgi:hypothetical protein